MRYVSHLKMMIIGMVVCAADGKNERLDRLILQNEWRNIR